MSGWDHTGVSGTPPLGRQQRSVASQNLFRFWSKQAQSTVHC